MAEVWAAEQYGKHGFQRTVAIKTILAQHASDVRARRMFLEEAKLVASIRHPNVAEIYDFGEERDVLFMVLEYVEGDSVMRLHRACRSADKPLPPAVALRIVADACLGLHAAHEHMADDGTSATIIHRDVSPQNILCSTSGAVKLIDFGIAKMVGAMRQETTGGLKGKVYYMAPEQALGRAADRRADIWALGATLFKLLEGRSPFAGANELETLHLLTTGAKPSAMTSAPRQIRDVVERALQYEPEDRYQTAEEMYAELDATIASLYGRITQRDLAVLVNERLANAVSERRQQLTRAKEGAVERAKLARELESKAVRSGEVSHSDAATVLESPPRERPAPQRAPRLDQPGSGGALPLQHRPAVRAGVLVGLALFAAVGLTVLLARRATPDPSPASIAEGPAPVAAKVSTAQGRPSSFPLPVPVQSRAPAPTPESGAAAPPAKVRVSPRMPPPPTPPPKSPLDVVTNRK